MPRKYYIQATSPLGPKIHITKSYWDYIVSQKHPEIKSQKTKAVETLKNPDIIKQSQADEKIFLYYLKKGNLYFCVVAKHLNSEGFIITAYITRKSVKGEIVWRNPKR